jgi:hypothetical protein
MLGWYVRGKTKMVVDRSRLCVMYLYVIFMKEDV